MKKIISAFCFFIPVVTFADLKVLKLSTADGIFSPEILAVPAGERFKLELTNSGHSAEEFESWELNREKVVVPGQTVTIFIGPLSAGEYGYFGDFHRSTAKGKLIAK